MKERGINWVITIGYSLLLSFLHQRVHLRIFLYHGALGGIGWRWPTKRKDKIHTGIEKYLRTDVTEKRRVIVKSEERRERSKWRGWRTGRENRHNHSLPLLVWHWTLFSSIPVSRSSYACLNRDSQLSFKGKRLGGYSAPCWLITSTIFISWYHL